MELVIIARFYACAGNDDAVAAEVEAIAPRCRLEDGCLSYSAFRSTLDPRRFFLMSRWVDEASFERHYTTPHLMQFLARMEKLVDHPLDISRTVEFARS